MIRADAAGSEMGTPRLERQRVYGEENPLFHLLCDLASCVSLPPVCLSVPSLRVKMLPIPGCCEKFQPVHKKDFAQYLPKD